MITSSMNPVEQTYLQGVWYRFKRHKMAMLSLALLLLISLAALAAPWIATHDYRETNPRYSLQAPGSSFILGTDRLGRDIFSRVLWGGRISLIVGFTAAFVAVVAGTLVGVIAGYFGGWIDNLLMRLTDVFMAFPLLFLLLTIVALLPKTVSNIVLVIGLTSWPSLARTVRGQFLSLREMDFVEAARSVGAKDMRIAFRHILPNTVAPIIVGATLRIGGLFWLSLDWPSLVWALSTHLAGVAFLTGDAGCCDRRLGSPLSPAFAYLLPCWRLILSVTDCAMHLIHN